MISFLSLKDVNALYAEEIHEAVKRVVVSGWYLRGEENRCFEANYAHFIGVNHAVGCANGLDALTLIFRAYKELGMMKEGDEVIVPANTYIATILAITENGLTPLLCEPRTDTLEIDDDKIEELITPRTRALCIVHLYGRNAYTEKIGRICQEHDLLLVEDCAQSHGCKASDGRVTGSLGHAAGHSFYPGKNLGALGDGGAVTTNDETLAQTIRTLANYGSESKYIFPYCGRNSRLDELQAAVLNVKLRHLAQDNKKRQSIADFYYRNISNPLITLPCKMDADENVYHLFPLLCDRRDELQQHLLQSGIETLIHYPLPPHRQECYRNTPLSALSLPVTDDIANHELSIPISQALSMDDAMTIVEQINSFK